MCPNEINKEKDWQLLILQLRAVATLVCQVQFPLQQLRAALTIPLVYVHSFYLRVQTGR